MKRLFAAAALALTLVGGTAFAQTAQKMKIKSFTGQIQIKLADGSIIGVVPGAAIPDIPAGAEIVVVSGEATFSAGGTEVSAKAGDSFSYSAPAAGGVGISATGANTNITVKVGGTSAVVKSGSAVSVTGTGATGSLAVTSGEASVTSGGTTTTLAQGQTKTVTVTTPAPSAPAATPTTKAVVVVKEGTSVETVLAAAGLTTNTATVVVIANNANAEEALETELGIATDVSPSSP